MSPTDPHAATLLARPKRNYAAMIAEGWIRCMSCRGRKGKTAEGTTCRTCGGEGWIAHRKEQP
jgi:DnaJ-class molecular chaperone